MNLVKTGCGQNWKLCRIHNGKAFVEELNKDFVTAMEMKIQECKSTLLRSAPI
jgi:hypothetical protein